MLQYGGCERCCLITDKLELHHKHYDTLGDESDEDVEILCEFCHKKADRQRASHMRKRLYNKRMNAWASKRYGEMWELWKDEDEVEQQFDEWIERREMSR